MNRKYYSVARYGEQVEHFSATDRAEALACFAAYGYDDPGYMLFEEETGARWDDVCDKWFEPG